MKRDGCLYYYYYYFETVMYTIVLVSSNFHTNQPLSKLTFLGLDHAGLYQDGLVTKPRLMEGSN